MCLRARIAFAHGRRSAYLRARTHSVASAFDDHCPEARVVVRHSPRVHRGRRVLARALHGAGRHARVVGGRRAVRQRGESAARGERAPEGAPRRTRARTRVARRRPEAHCGGAEGRWRGQVRAQGCGARSGQGRFVLRPAFCGARCNRLERDRLRDERDGAAAPAVDAGTRKDGRGADRDRNQAAVAQQQVGGASARDARSGVAGLRPQRRLHASSRDRQRARIGIARFGAAAHRCAAEGDRRARALVCRRERHPCFVDARLRPRRIACRGGDEGSVLRRDVVAAIAGSACAHRARRRCELRRRQHVPFEPDDARLHRSDQREEPRGLRAHRVDSAR